jgi:hypothetical protein
MKVSSSFFVPGLLPRPRRPLRGPLSGAATPAVPVDVVDQQKQLAVARSTVSPRT